MKKSIFPVIININETDGLNRNNCSVRLGIPFPCGELKAIKELQLNNQNGDPIPFQAKITASWHDNSIRWILIDFLSSLPANSNLSYSLLKSESHSTLPLFNKIRLKKKDKHIIINTGLAEFKINKKQFLPFNTISINDQKLDINQFSTELIDSEVQPYRAVIEEITYPEEPEELRTTLCFKGHFEKNTADQDKKTYLNFQSSLSFFSNSALCEIEFTLHNPKAAKHPGGFWDMGDAGSEFFKSLSLNIHLSHAPTVQWKNQQEQNWKSLEGDNIRLYQDSSGGEKWNHHLHIDKNNNSTVSFKGYQLKSDDNIIDQGNRATPIFLIDDNNNTQVKVSIKQFWQNFPKALSVNNNQLNIEIFPDTPKSNYELQGGEQKTHSIALNFENNNDLEQYIAPLKATLAISHYESCEAMPALPKNHNPTALDKLINQGIEGDESFFIKREEADEYGWRNFGELWADHETLEHGNDRSLVSHYNNQYDPIYGFARQYLLTGEQRWYELMCDLAKHVIDIDIYHTNQDRPEYNNGLFWHTDHYLDGRHCTHRTFSKTHMDIDHVEQSGGGPGSEHCYSKGLKYYYWLTGNNSAKQSTIKLSKWAKYPNEGGYTIIERLFNFIKYDLKKIKRIKNGEYLFNYQFPLNRGTGNYLSSLIDAYDLEPNEERLKKAIYIIKQTIGPNDEIKYRCLMTDIESFWHYTIFLQSVLIFIKIKESTNNLDEDYQYALQSFCHYSQWLADNEKPYLENASLLVYPNDTWVAQDCRKLYLLKSYLKYSPSKYKHDIQKKIELFERYISNYFEKNKNETTRILAIMMQNQINYNDASQNIQENITKVELKISDKKLTIIKTLTQFISDLIRRLFKLNIKNEYLWIKSRLKK